MYKLLRKHGETKGSTMKRFETLLCRFFLTRCGKTTAKTKKRERLANLNR